tara:strand:- start:415 stop:933 length:519 start_codon:yes stop_codon:yes gene_type:complete
MVVRYDPGVDHENNTFDLELVDYTTPNNTEPILGKLSSLLDWHLSDPVDDFEINRNEIIFGFQENRNPFIDHPNLVNYLWGDNVGLVWNENLTVPENEILKTIIYPNPSSGIINFSSDMQDEIIEIFNLNGQNILNKIIDSSNSLELDLPSGIYFIRCNTKSGNYNSKLIIN